MREHEPSCPKAQFWDGGEVVPCLCRGKQKSYFSTAHLKKRLKRWLESEQVRIRALGDGYNLAPGDRQAYKHICQLIETYNRDQE
jgi:hypothetical protein